MPDPALAQTSRRALVGLLALAAGLMLLGALMRTPVLLDYGGPHAPHPLNVYLSEHVGAYSDISHLYFRDRLWSHPAPYFDYRFEYPVLTGALVWVAGFVHSSVGAYFVSSTVILLGLGLLSVWAIARIDGANPWVFAAAPALAFYANLNWDLLGVFLFAAAMLLFQRKRDGPASAVLALATCAKLFPVVVLPVVLALRLAERRWRAAAGIAGVFTAVTLVVNLPFALRPGGHPLLRPFWTYFFSFTQSRPPRATIWKPVLGHASDLVTEPLFLAGMATIVVLAVRSRARPGGALFPASTAALLWLFATAKVYSPQYALWILAALAIDGAPVWMAVAFVLVDVLVFTTTFGPLYPVGPLSPGFPVEVQWTVYGVRQVLTAALAFWIVRTELCHITAGEVGERPAAASSPGASHTGLSAR